MEKQIKNANEILKNQNEEIKKGKKTLDEMEKDYNKIQSKLQEIKSRNLGSIFKLFSSVVLAPFTFGLSLYKYLPKIFKIQNELIKIK